MKQSPQVLIREYPNAKQVNQDAQKLYKQGWLIADTQVITTTKNGGCLLGLFGSVASRSTTKYLVRYQRVTA
jgi:hypothetical protein